MDLIDLPEPQFDLPPLVEEEDPVLADSPPPEIPVDVADIVYPDVGIHQSRIEALAANQETPPDPSIGTLMDAYALGPTHYALEVARYIEFINAQNIVVDG